MMRRFSSASERIDMRALCEAKLNFARQSYKQFTPLKSDSRRLRSAAQAKDFVTPMKALLASLLTLSSSVFALDLQGDFKGPVGLQLYSLRETFKTDPIEALDKAKAFGFTVAELYSNLPLEPE